MKSKYNFDIYIYCCFFSNKIGADVSVTKFSFTKVFRDAWQRAYSSKEYTKAFEIAGICLWTKERPDYSKCGASKLFEPLNISNVKYIASILC